MTGFSKYLTIITFNVNDLPNQKMKSNILDLKTNLNHIIPARTHLIHNETYRLKVENRKGYSMQLELKSKHEVISYF